MSDENHEAAMEIARLAPWRAAYGAFYGHAPEVRQRDDGLRTLVFQPERDRFDLFRRMVGTFGGFAKKPRLLAHLRALGFDWSEDGVLLTIPTPASFRVKMAALGLAMSGFVPEILVLEGLDIPAGAWLSHLMRAVVPMNIGTAKLYARELSMDPYARPLRRENARWQQSIIHHLLALLHDTTKHVLTFHLVPRSCLFDLGERARAAIGPLRRWLGGEVSIRHARPLGSVPKGWLAPVPLLTFYENDLVDYCRRVWEVVDRPEDFVPTFTRRAHYEQLVDVFSRRMVQSKRISALLQDLPPRPYARFEVERKSAEARDGSTAESRGVCDG